MKTALLLAAVTGCTFPTVTFTDASTSLDASAVEASLDAADEASDAMPPSEGGEGGNPCDKDNDTYIAESCGGTDCDDNDPLVHPGQTFQTIIPDAGSNFGDWNCDGVVEKEFPTMSCNIAVCGNTEGFAIAEGCGVTGQYETCSGLCAYADAGARTQGCR